MRAGKKSDGDLKRHQSLYETLALCSGVAVFAGLALEVCIAIEFRPNGETAAQTWGPIFADLLVAGGVFFEILFGRWALHQGSELQQRAENALAEATERAGEAIERAAEAELQTEKLRTELAWRRISSKELKKISEVLSRTDLPKLCLRIIHPAGDPEAITFAHDIADAFRASGWRVLLISLVSTNNLSGMLIPVWEPPNWDACAIARTAIVNAGIEFMGGPPPPTSGMTMASGDNVSGPTADIYVGSKPAPKLD